MRSVAVLVTLLVIFGADGAETQSQTYRIERIDIGRTFTGMTSSAAVAVSDAGVVTGAAQPIRGGSVAYTWSRERGFRVRLENAQPTDINRRGQIVGFRHCVDASCVSAGFVWSASTGARDLGSFFPEAINENGDMAGRCVSEHKACAHIAGEVVEVAPRFSWAHDINEEGLVVGYLNPEATSIPAHPFVWTIASGRRMLDDSGFDWGYGLAVNDFGQAVGELGRIEGDDVAIAASRWRRIGRFTAVHRDNTSALSVNNRGRVVGYGLAPDSAGMNHYYPILWRLGRIIRLPLGGHSDGIAYDINNRGEIAGVLFTPTPGGSGATAVLWRLIEQ